MWDYVGVVRTSKRLARVQRRVKLLLSEIDEYYGNFRIRNDLIESALARCDSRGLHYTLDFPGVDGGTPPADTILTPPRR